MGNSFPVSLDEWNAALIEAVFFEPSRVGSTLSRIDATGRIFEQLAGSRSKDETRLSFFNAFGKTSSQIRAHFKYSTKIDMFTKEYGIPPHFAALYLTLLAASADDETHKEGDFRVRFSILLGFTELQKYPFSDLPKMWQQLAAWSHQRRESKGDCAQLLLPVPPASEKLIGHSKRLSFPCYKDEIQLRDLLSTKKLDSHSSFQKVNEAIHHQLFSFNEIFNYEVNVFNRLLLNASWHQAYDSPFWGAVRDITLQEEGLHATENGHFCVQLDATDPLYPEIYLLMDDKGACMVGTDKFYSLSENVGVYSKVFYESNVNATLTYLASLLQRQKKGLFKSRVGMALLSGCLPLLRSDSGNYFSSDGHYIDNGPICLVICSKYVESIGVACKSLNLKFSSLGLGLDSTDWEIIVFDSLIRKTLVALAKSLPEAAQHFLIQCWTPARPYITGGARFGQSVLLNPASTPIIRMEGVIGGRYVISDSAGKELAVGELTLSDEGLYIPPEKLSTISGQTFCRYLLTLRQQENPLIFEVPILDHAPFAMYRRLNEPHNWLTDGQLGTLVPLDSIDNNVSSIMPLNEKKFIPLGGVWSLWQKNEHSPAECKLIDINSIPASLDWLAEALALRFQRRSTLPFNELNKHIMSVSKAIGIHAWRLRRMLFAAGWLCVTESRYAPYQVVSLGDRAISASKIGQHIVARISGMLTKSERNQLQSTLTEGEQAKRWSVSGNDLAIGCIELNLSGFEHAELLAEQFGLRLISKCDFPISPLSGVLLPITQVEHIPALPTDINVATWQEEKKQWSEGLVSINTNSNAFMRSHEKQRNRYFISTQDGYWQTDSFVWGLMVQTIFSQKILGTRSHNGDLYWSKSLITLPPSVTQWWLHFAGGCLSIGEDGNFIFTGGGDSIWGNVERSGFTTQPCAERAIERRSRALKLRKSRERI